MIHAAGPDGKMPKGFSVFADSSCCMTGRSGTAGNTTPDASAASAAPAVRESALDSAERSAKVNVLTTGSITKGIAGEELAPIGSLKNAGVVAITDDGQCVQDNDLMRRALEYTTMFNLPVMDHCQDYSLVGAGVMHSPRSTRCP